MVPCEPLDHLETISLGDLTIYYNKQIEYDVSHIEVDFQSDWSGTHLVVTAGF